MTPADLPGNALAFTAEAVRAARRAGAAILRVYQGPFAVQQKADHTPLTEADLASAAAIEQALEPTGLPMLSEERAQEPYELRRSWPWFWLVDPLDGTKEFVSRNGEFTVNIALVHDGHPWAGVVYAPVTAEMAFACRGSGAWCAELPPAEVPADLSWDQLVPQAAPLPRPSTARPYTVAASRSHLSDTTRAYIDSLRKQHSALELVSRGSALKFVMIARGEADVYPRFGPTMEWDTAAGHAVVAEAGGSVVRAEAGEELRYNKPDLVNPSFIARRRPDSQAEQGTGR